MTTHDIRHVCQLEWGLASIDAIEPLAREPGSMALYHVRQDHEYLLFKVHLSSSTLDDLERNARTTDFLAVGGIPTPRYLRTNEGRVAAPLGANLCTLRPWVEGHVLERSSLTAPQMKVLGRTLARCHRTLAALPPGEDFPWATGLPKIAEQLGQLAARLRAGSAPGEMDEEVLDTIARRQARLRLAGNPGELFAPHPVQIVHGDYYLGNVLFHQDGSLAGVIDLEGWSTCRIREVYQAIAWSQRSWNPAGIDLPLATSFIEGYLEEEPLTPEELRRGPEILRVRLLRSLHDIRTYVDDPSNGDARDGILWFDAMAGWLAANGEDLGVQLARLPSGT